tara:strand:+ start:256 stop:918 length:663 start_codon:yes stop_codon:yes gene_type:complete
MHEGAILEMIRTQVKLFPEENKKKGKKLNIESKTCVTCKECLPLDNFYWHFSDSRHYSNCKSCSRMLSKKWKIDNAERTIESHHKYINSERGFIADTINGIWSRPNQKNKRKKWPPNCTKQDIYDELMLYIQDNGRNCEYCKQPWTYFRKKGTSGNGYVKRTLTTDTNFSIDRLDATKTYETGENLNLVFCCAGCNNRKNQVRLSDIVNIMGVWMKRIRK